MDAAFEVAVAREDRDDVEVALLHVRLDLRRRERAAVPDAVVHGYTVRDKRVHPVD